MEWDDELEEFAAEAAEAMKTKLEGVKSEPVTLGTLSDILDTLQDEDDDEEPGEDPDTVKLVRSIEWLRSKRISAEDIVDFVKYVYR